MKKKKGFKIILIMSSLPFIIILILALKNTFAGTTFIFSEIYGIDAFIVTCLAGIINVWPLLLLCLLYQIIYLITFCMNKSKNKHI